MPLTPNALHDDGLVVTLSLTPSNRRSLHKHFEVLEHQACYILGNLYIQPSSITEPNDLMFLDIEEYCVVALDDGFDTPRCPVVVQEATGDFERGWSNTRVELSENVRTTHSVAAVANIVAAARVEYLVK